MHFTKCSHVYVVNSLKRAIHPPAAAWSRTACICICLRISMQNTGSNQTIRIMRIPALPYIVDYSTHCICICMMYRTPLLCTVLNSRTRSAINIISRAYIAASIEAEVLLASRTMNLIMHSTTGSTNYTCESDGRGEHGEGGWQARLW